MLALVLLWPATLPAQGTATPSSPPEQPEFAAAPVMLDGQTLFRVRGVTAFPAPQRAHGIVQRIRDVAHDRKISPASVHTAATNAGTAILAGQRRIMIVVQADAQLEGVEKTSVLADVYASRIAVAITAYRHDRSPPVLLADSLFAVGATLLLLLLRSGLRRLFQWAQVQVDRRLESRGRGLEFKSFHVLEHEQLRSAALGALRFMHVVAVLAAVWLWLQFLLSLYPWTREAGDRMFAAFSEPLSSGGIALLRALPKLFFVVLIVVAARYALKILRLFFSAVDRSALELSGFDREWAWPTYKLIRVVIVAFAAVVAYPFIPGSNSVAFKGVSIFLGVILSLGSTSAIGNLIAGYTMTYRRAFRIGDRIKVEEFVGDVVEMRLLVTHLRSLKNEEVVVPNSLILASSVINYSSLARDRGLILHTTVGIGYEVPWRQVEAMLLMAADRTPGLLKEPPPFVLQTSLADFSVIYEINVYCDDPHAMLRLYTLLHRNILDSFNEYGVQIMTPAYRGDPHDLKVVPRDQWFAAPASPPAERSG